MLQKLRTVATSRIAAIVIFVPLIISFAAWGIADVFKGSVDSSVATVGDTKIPAEDYQRDFNNMLKGERGPNGEPMTTDEARKLVYAQRVLDGLIDQVAMRVETTNRGLSVSDAQVAQTIQSLPAFAGPLGSFDHTTFLRLISDRGYSEQGFIELVRSDMARNQFVSGAGTGMSLPPGYVMPLLQFLNERRAAEYIVMPASAAGSVPNPTDAQLADYVKKNAARFSTPEYREVTYGEISPDDLSSQIQITDAQLKQQYELMKANPMSGYVVPEKRDVQQITFTKEADAVAAKAKIDSGTTFADAARTYGGVQDLGTVDQAGLGERGAATFALSLNGTTAPQKNLAGYALLHVTKIVPGTNKTFDDVKGDLRKDALAQLAQSKLSEIGNNFTDANSGGMSLDDAAKKVGMHVTHLTAVDKNGLAPDGSKTDAASEPDLLAQIFAAEIGEDGDPFNTKDGKMFVVKVDGVTPPKVKSIDSVRAEATAAWIAEQRAQFIAKKANALAAQATSQNSLSAVAASVGASVVKTGSLSRPDVQGANNPPELPKELIAKLFDVPGGHAVAGPAGTGDSYIIARVSGVAHQPIDPQSLEFFRETQSLGQQAAQDFPDAIAKSVRNKEGVTVNQANAARITGEGQ